MSDKVKDYLVNPDTLSGEQGIEKISIVKEMKNSFIDYAMSVIVSRAIPDARDGMKPVHRRILFAMSTLGLSHKTSYKKSARVVGDVIGKYHPHGDSSVYEAMVRMAQPFSMRYMLVDGQGNFGNVDGDSAAAMRYTEARLRKITGFMLEDIKKDTVDFRDNYDGSEQEPEVLPGKIPNLLVNGSTGIAVGMATSIPPHNLTEVLEAAKAYATNSEISAQELTQFVAAPDFPTGGILINPSETRSAYLSGRGRAIVRAKTEIKFNEVKNSGKIYVTEIPYMVNKANLVTKIAELARDKKIDSISKVNDLSSREGIKIEIKLKRGFIPEVELNKLFKLTQLQSSFPMNILALVDGKPETLDLKMAIKSYVDHQVDVLVRRTKYDLRKAEARMHILEGLSKALKNIDAIIEMIKKSKDTAEANATLQSQYGMSEIQAKAILEMRLNRLTGLERDNLEAETKDLAVQVSDHNFVINSTDEQMKRISDLFDQIIEEFGDERRTEISQHDMGSISDEDLIPREDVVITLSNRGYVKRLPLSEYKVQNRGGVGVRGATTQDDDFIADIIVANTHTDILLFTSFGRVFKIRAHKIPSLGKTAKGLPIINLIDIEQGETIKSVLPIHNYESDLVFVTKMGLIKRTVASEFERVNRNGKKAIILRDGDELLGTKVVEDEQAKVIIGNSNGKAIRFRVSDVRRSGRYSSGVKGIDLDGGIAVDFGISTNGEYILTLSDKGFGKLTEEKDYRLTNRSGKGVITLNTDSAGSVVALANVQGDEDLMVITDKGTTIRTSLDQLSVYSRNTKGTKVVNLREGESIVSKTVVKGNKEIEAEIEATQEIKLEDFDIQREEQVEEKGVE